ncbi:hypothetical protein D3C76_1783630 [compost metagenome]
MLAFADMLQFIRNGIVVKYLDVFLSPLFLLTMIRFGLDRNVPAANPNFFAEFIL